MEYDEDSVSPYCCSRPRHHGILRNDDTHHSTTPAIGYTALPFMVGPANQKLPFPSVIGPWVQHKFGIYIILIWLARKWFWTSAIGSNSFLSWNQNDFAPDSYFDNFGWYTLIFVTLPPPIAVLDPWKATIL